MNLQYFFTLFVNMLILLKCWAGYLKAVIKYSVHSLNEQLYCFTNSSGAKVMRYITHYSF